MMTQMIDFLFTLSGMVENEKLQNAINSTLATLGEKVEVAEDSIAQQKETITCLNAEVDGLAAQLQEVKHQLSQATQPLARYNLDAEWVKKYALAMYKNDPTTRIPAIKLVRDLTYQGLAECKAFVDNMIAQYQLELARKDAPTPQFFSDDEDA